MSLFSSDSTGQNDDSQLMHHTEAAEELGVHPLKLGDLVAKGQIAPRGAAYFHRKDVIELKNRRKAQ